MHQAKSSYRSCRELPVLSFALLCLLLMLTVSASAHGSQKVQIETVQFKSGLVGQVLPYHALLPAGYSDSNTRYPVLYLLHGLSGRYDNWLTYTNLADYVSNYKIIVITPEGHDGWYTDSATVPSGRYESYVIQELIPEVDQRFRTIRDRRARGVAGLSMGGYGALKFALKRPDLFAFAASMSGAFDASVRSDERPGFLWDFLKPSIVSVFGTKGSATRSANDLHQLARNLSPAQVASLPYIYFDCGTEDGFLETNRDLDSILLSKKVAHEFRQLPGGHDWGYWDRQVREVLRLYAGRTNM
jgi:putative tributyrin esterase